ncbi:MAG: DUF5050 domain-containing protein [Bifidobacteriaceae bacterium]|jgi:hypothetical protein|nr:DUF5050 domain-containing protein [Bifidobacteriaceae bacterium]
MDDDAAAFRDAYRNTLSQAAAADWPEAVTALYEPVSCLKQTDSSQVWLAQDRRTGGRVVLRVAESEAEQGIDAELDVLAALRHPGIPRIYGALESHGRSYLSREYFEGLPLDQVVAQGTIPPDRVRLIGRQLCAILGHIHSHSPPVVHRDIKPQNIILRPDGAVGLTDFGIARTFKQGKLKDTERFGTPEFAPPEQHGYAQSSPLADIFALGVVLIYLATGSADRRNLAERIPDAALRSAVERCVAFDPKDRFQNAADLAKALEPPRSRRRRALVVGAAVLVPALVATGVWLALPRSPSQIAEIGTNHSSATPGLQAPLSGAEAGVGNRPGNIAGGQGVATWGGGFIYIATAQGVYQVDMDGDPTGLVAETGDATSLNYWEGDLYYSSSAEGIVRCDPATAQCLTLLDEPTGSMFIDGGMIYFQRATQNLLLHKMTLDGSDVEQADVKTGHYAVVYQGFHYFSDPEDGERLHRTELATGLTKLIYDRPSAWPSPEGDTIYFSDFSNPAALMTAKLDGGDTRQLRAEAASRTVAYADGLVYVDGTGTLVRSTLDGATVTRLTHT